MAFHQPHATLQCVWQLACLWTDWYDTLSCGACAPSCSQPTTYDSLQTAWPVAADLVSSRGNGPAYAAGGSDTVTSGLHAGPYAAVDLGSLLQASKKMPLDLADDFHVYGLLWYVSLLALCVLHRAPPRSCWLPLRHGARATARAAGCLCRTPTEIVTYIDDPSIEILRVPFDVPMWSRAPFPNTVTNPWAGANNNAAPFDQEFYLVLSCTLANDARKRWE
ncbi:hypothetical protein EON66_00895 [archaeon]|nr:MAG: hypothetical protein EON66_00895 [archaeon]